MKKIMNLIFAVVACCFCSCSDTITERVEYMINEPVFMAADEFRHSVNVLTVPRPIEVRGKICFYNGYLYISEPGAGIHIIDNRNPASPQSVGFVELLGNVDVSIKNDRLYGDSYIDLVWFDLKDPSRPEFLGRLENVFPYALPCIENGFGYDYDLCYEGSERGQVVVDWKLEKRSKLVTTYKNQDKAPMYDSAMNYGSSSSGGMSSGVTGSMSRFGLYDKYLYVVMNSMMTIFDLEGDTPVKVGESFHVNWEVETIFPYKNYLFLGIPDGMAIYSVANPQRPEYICTVWHIYGCDPVVVEDDIAYVTIHSDNWCRMDVNQLMIIDVSDVYSPNPLVTYSMKKPKGLGIDNGTLFICDDGLQIFDAKDPMTLMANRLVHYPGMNGYDCIPYNNVLMMIADDGLYQYDYTDLTKISQLSHLKVGK